MSRLAFAPRARRSCPRGMPPLTCAASPSAPIHLVSHFLCSCAGRPSEEKKLKRPKKTLAGILRPKKSKVVLEEPVTVSFEAAPASDKPPPSPSSRSSSCSASPRPPGEAHGGA